MNNNLSLSVQYASSMREVPNRAQFRRWVKVALRHDASITLRIVDEQEGRMLNRDYRGKDYATNVLAFVYDDNKKHGIDILLADVVLCAPVVAREAAEQHKDLLAHYAHLAVHAMLHVQGFEHESDSGAAGMETLETALMLKLRYPDPYQAS